MNIFQEALITAWFITKLGFLTLTAIGAKVVWDRYGHHARNLLTDRDEPTDADEWLEEMYR